MKKNALNTMKTLEDDLSIIKQLVDYQLVIKKNKQRPQTKKYFRLTRFFYRYFHSKEGAMHFPLYVEGLAQEHAVALQTQAHYIGELIRRYELKNVSEMGCGMGYNAFLLAQQFPDVRFKAYDISLSSLAFARKRIKAQSNLSYFPSAWQSPQHWNKPIDLMFAVESFCYAEDVAQVFAALSQKLNAGGHFVIFDAFNTAALQEASMDLEEAISLTAWAFALKAWHRVEEVEKTAQQYGFVLRSKIDFSEAVMPNLLRFQQDMQSLCRKKWFTALAQSQILPEVLLGHITGGLLGGHTLASKAQGYFYLHFQKEN